LDGRAIPRSIGGGAVLTGLPAGVGHGYNPAMMMTRIKRSVVAALLGWTLILSAPSHALARSDDDVEHYDARIMGYEPSMELKSWTAGTAWMLVAVMMVVVLLPMFKDAKRSHLD
jgi:hypothetical protein